MSTIRTYNLFPDGNNPIIIKIPVFDQYENNDGIRYNQEFPIPYEQIDDEIIVNYDGEIMSMADFKRKVILSNQSEAIKTE